ncbi:MAG: hypothetical protein WD810_09270 [Solirubrobacterales bacterium]
MAGVLIAGCGEESGVSSGATVSVYVAASLCPEAGEVLAGEVDPPRDIRVRAICLANPQRGGQVNLATIGGNARRATEDSAAVAYIEGSNPAAAKFSRPIVEAANIAWTTASSGEAAMAQVLRAIAEADSSSLRDEVREALE